MSEDAITFYYWPTPNGFKIAIMLEETGFPYDVHYLNINAAEQFEPAFLKISPNNKMPAIIDPDGPDGNELAIFESGAILQYLARKSEKFYPINERKRADVDQWLFWQVGGLGPMMGQALHFLKYAPEKVPYGIERYSKEVTRLFGVMDRQLKNQRYLAGDYSIADIASYPWILRWRDAGLNIADFPAIEGWLQRVGARPAVQRGMALGAVEGARTNA